MFVLLVAVAAVLNTFAAADAVQHRSYGWAGLFLALFVGLAWVFMEETRLQDMAK